MPAPRNPSKMFETRSQAWKEVGLLRQISTRVVKRAKVASLMPADSVKVTKEERAKQMMERFHAIQKRYAL